MRDSFSQKITYEEISAITQKIYPSVGGFYLKSTKQFYQKKEISPRIIHDHEQTTGLLQNLIF